MKAPFPGIRFVHVGSSYPDDAIPDCRSAVRAELGRVALKEPVSFGCTAAIAVGSRGIDRYDEIVRAAAEWLGETGARPVIVPAMGSHAGGSAESQQELLLHTGIGGADFPAAVRSSTETTLAGRTEAGDSVFIDAIAARADLLVVINRVKAHTDFDDPIESGVAKMLTVGLGKPQGAREMHRAFQRHGFYPALTAAVELLLSKMPRVIGLAIIENERHQCQKIVALEGREILTREPELLREAKQRMALLPIDELDLLVVEEIGKNVSGSGMDTNVINRKSLSRIPAENRRPKIRYIYVRSLSSETAGNGVGIGLADFCHPRVLDQIDLSVTYLNCLTSGTPRGAALPVHLCCDREVVAAVAGSVPVEDVSELKVAWIRNTQSVADFFVSEALLAGDAGLQALKRLGPATELEQLDDGDFRSPFAQEA